MEYTTAIFAKKMVIAKKLKKSGSGRMLSAI